MTAPLTSYRPRDDPRSPVLVQLHKGGPSLTLDPDLYESLTTLYLDVRALGPSHDPSHFNTLRSMLYLPLSTRSDPAWSLGIIRLTVAGAPGLYLTYHPELADWRYELIPTTSL